MAAIILGKREAVRIASILTAFKDALDEVFVDVSDGWLRLYGSDSPSAVIFSILVKPEKAETSQLRSLGVNGKDLTRSFRRFDDLLNEDITDLMFDIQDQEVALVVRTESGEARQSFMPFSADPPITPETVESYLVDPIKLKDWVFVKSALKATQDATEVGEMVVKTSAGKISFISQGPTSQGTVNMEAEGIEDPQGVVVKKGLLLEAFSQPSAQQPAYPSGCVIMSIQEDGPLTVQFQDTSTRLTIALGTVVGEN